jgi:Domain of unknown function (DUF4340)
VRAHGRNLLLLLGAAVLALPLGLYAYFGVLRSEERAAKEKEAKEKLVVPRAQPDGGAELVRYDRLLITVGTDSSELGRLPDAAWVLIKPFHARADPRVAEDVISTLQSLRLTRVVDENPKEEDLVRYGLQPPRFTVTATAGGAQPLTFLGGMENSFDGSVYVQRAGDPKVYAAEGFVTAALGKHTEDLRARDVLGPRDLGLLGMQLKSAQHEWAVAREPEKPWTFQKPSGMPADGASISSWVARLAQARAVKFLSDSPAERKRTGVEKPAVDASFRRIEETIRVRLAAGPLEADPGYVLREDSFGVTLAEVPHSALATMDIPLAELRDRRVLVFEPAKVERLRILPDGGGPTFVVQREPADAGTAPRWLLVSRTPQQASTSKVGTLLYSLANLKWVPTEETRPKDPGLGATARTLVLEDAQGQVLGTLVLGKVASRRDNTIWTRTASGEVVQVDTTRLVGLPARAEDLLEVTALPSPDAAR